MILATHYSTKPKRQHPSGSFRATCVCVFFANVFLQPHADVLRAGNPGSSFVRKKEQTEEALTCCRHHQHHLEPSLFGSIHKFFLCYMVAGREMLPSLAGIYKEPERARTAQEGGRKSRERGRSSTGRKLKTWQEAHANPLRKVAHRWSCLLCAPVRRAGVGGI